MDEAQERARALACAAAWVGTRYMHRTQLMAKRDGQGRIVDPGGVDCIGFIYRSFLDAGLIKPFAFPAYNEQWMLHRSDEKLLDAVLLHAREVETPQPADIALFRYGRTWSHAALVVEPGWPHILHAEKGAGCVLPDFGDQGRLAGRKPQFFSRWAV